MKQDRELARLDSINEMLRGAPVLDEDALFNLSDMMPDVLEAAFSTGFEKTDAVETISSFWSCCSALEFGNDMKASVSVLHKTFTLVNVTSKAYQNFQDAVLQRKSIKAFSNSTHDFVEAMTKSYQQFRSEQKIPLDKINSLYHQCGQKYEKWTADKRSEVSVVVKKDVMGPQLKNLLKEQKLLIQICRGGEDGQAWFKDLNKKPWLPTFKKTLKVWDKKQLQALMAKVKNLLDSVEADVDFYAKGLHQTRENFICPANEVVVKESDDTHFKCKVTQCEVLCCLALEAGGAKAESRIMKNMAGHEVLENKLAVAVVKNNSWKDLMHPFVVSDIVKHIDEVRARAQGDLGTRATLKQLNDWLEVQDLKK